MDVPAWRACAHAPRRVLAPSLNAGGLLGGATVASIVTVILALSVPSAAATVTVYVSPAISVIPGLREKLAVCRADVEQTPHPALRGCSSACRPESASVAATGNPMDVPAEARLRSRSAWRSTLPANTGGLLAPGALVAPMPALRPAARALRVLRPHLHLVGRARRQALKSSPPFPVIVVFVISVQFESCLAPDSGSRSR